MKKIEAIIRRERLDVVKAALDALNCPGIQVWEIMGHGKQQGVTEQFRGREFKLDFLPKMKLEIVVKDSMVASVVSAIQKSACTQTIGDGKIFVSSVEEVIRIRTNEKGEVAI